MHFKVGDTLIQIKKGNNKDHIGQTLKILKITENSVTSTPIEHFRNWTMDYLKENFKLIKENSIIPNENKTLLTQWDKLQKKRLKLKHK